MSLIIAQAASGIEKTNEAISEEPAWSGQPITLTFSEEAAEYEHALLYQPEGAAAALSGALTQQASFTPTLGVAGTYVIFSRARRVSTGYEDRSYVIRVGFDDEGREINGGLIAPGYAEEPIGGLVGQSEQHGATRQIERNEKANARHVTPQQLGNISGAVEIDLRLGHYIRATLTGDTTISFKNGPAAFALLDLDQGGLGGHVLAFANGGLDLVDPSAGVLLQTFVNTGPGQRSVGLWSASITEVFALGANYALS